MWQDFLNFLTQLFGSVSAFTPQIALFLFLICFISEGFIISIPLALDLVWLIAGTNLRNGILPPWDLLGLVLVAMVGRQLGALVLYFLSHKSTRFFTRFIARRVPKQLPENGNASGFINKVDSISPIGVAAGRLLWLRIPLTLLLGARGRLKTLMAGIAISSVIYETVYVGIGAGLGAVFGITADEDYAFLYFMGVLAVLYSLIFGIRFLVKLIKRRMANKASEENTMTKDNVSGTDESPEIKG
jgi:membrane-associated protein